MPQFNGMTVWTDVWVAATCHLSIAARGAYMDLLILMWRSPGCRVPNDNGWLQSHLRCTKDELRDLVRPVVEEFCRIDGNWIIQKRQQEEFLRLYNKSKRASDGAKARWAKKKEENKRNAEKIEPA